MLDAIQIGWWAYISIGEIEPWEEVSHIGDSWGYYLKIWVWESLGAGYE